MSVVLLPRSIPWKKQPESTTELSSHPVNQGILACYLFNEGTGNLRNLANEKLPGILTNGPAWGVSGFGRCLSFDGTDDYVNCGDVSTNASTVGNKITLLAWIKPTNLGSSGITSDVPIASKDDSLGASSQREWIWAFEGSNGLILRTIGGNNSPQPNVWTANEWQQAAIVWNVGTNVVTYRNGIEIATTALTDTSPNGTFRLEIGAWSTSSTPEFFEGEIGFFGVWQRGLSPSEIQNLYENPYLGLKSRRRWVPVVIQSGETVSLSGVSGTGQAGNINSIGAALLTLAGASASGQTGTIIVTTTSGATITLSGVSGTGNAGLLSATGAALLTATGTQGTGQAGPIIGTGGALAGLTGVSSTGQPGSVTIQVAGGISITLSGTQATGQAGTLTTITGASFALSGVASTGQAGTLTVTTTEGATVTLAGVQATGGAGDLILLTGATVILSGTVGTGQSGTVTATIPGTITIDLTFKTALILSAEDTSLTLQ